MPAVTPAQIDDMVKLTLSDYQRKSWVDLSADYTEYLAADIMQDASRQQSTSGLKYEWVLQYSKNENTKYSGLYGVDRTSQRPLSIRAEVPLTMVTTNLEYDINEQAFQSGNSTEIVNFMQMRLHSMYTELYEFLEEALWTAPSSSALSPMPIMGIPFWLQQNATATYNQYGGVNPSGWTSGRAGVSSSTYSRWANGTFRYSNITSDDLFKTMRRANFKSKFLAPHKFSELSKPGGSNCVYYTTEAVVNEASRLLEARNDNLGVDLAKYDGMALFNGCPFKAVDYLDETASTTAPIYGVNWNTFKFLYIKDRFMQLGDPMVQNDRHTVRIRHLDFWIQLYCNDLRRNWVAYLN